MKSLKSQVAQWAFAASAALALSMMTIPSASATITLTDWDADFRPVASGGPIPDAFPDGPGVLLQGLQFFESDGRTIVIQSPGDNGVVDTGDRFYEAAYLKVKTLNQLGVGNEDIDELIGADRSLYFVVEGGGTVNLPAGPALPTFSFDFARVSLILDNDDGVAGDNAEVQNADGVAFNDLIDAMIAELQGGSFVLPNTVSDFGASASGDGNLLELVRLDLGSISGIIPFTGLIAETGGEEGSFGAEVFATACLSGVFFNGATDEDLCDFADSEVELSKYDWEANGIVNSDNTTTEMNSVSCLDDANITCVSLAPTLFFQDNEGYFIAFGQTLGDLAQPSVPEPATLALLGLGLIGIGAIRRNGRYAS